MSKHSPSKLARLNDRRAERGLGPLTMAEWVRESAPEGGRREARLADLTEDARASVAAMTRSRTTNAERTAARERLVDVGTVLHHEVLAELPVHAVVVARDEAGEHGVYIHDGAGTYLSTTGTISAHRLATRVVRSVYVPRAAA